jgi:DNA primase
MTAIDEIKNRIDIVDLVSETVKLRRSGKSFTGFCPFHQNTRTPAFVVFPDSGTWRCFGQCNEGGDIFRFVMKKEGVDFPQALQILAQKAGVQLEPLTPEKKAEDEAGDHLRALLEEAVIFYRHHLLSPAGQGALNFLKKRGLTPETMETFGLGYAPDAWESAVQHFTKRGYSQKDLLDAGLATQRQEEGEQNREGRGIYDRFRNRVMFPIRDMQGRMAGFGARILDPNDIPKFLNSPQTPLFDKGRLLFGLDQARKAIRAQEQVVIVEGYLDVIVLHQAGFTNTVSPMGTALTEDQLRLLKRFTRRMVLALDADAAGQKATMRGLEIARQALDRTDELQFDARGLLRHEGRLEADLRVTTIPEGMDPDEVVLRDPEEWKRILTGAQPIVIHVMDTLAAGRDLEDPKVKGEVAAQVLPLIEDVPGSVEREAYRQRLARLLKVDERSLLGGRTRPQVARPARRSGQQSAAGKEVAPVIAPKPQHGLERHILRLVVRQPEGLYLLDRSLQQAGLSRFGVSDFEAADHQLMIRVIQQSLEQDRLDPMIYVQENIPESLQGYLQELIFPFPLGEPTSEQLVDDLIGSTMRLRYMKVKEWNNQLQFLQVELQEQGDAQLGVYSNTQLQYARILSSIDKALRGPVLPNDDL